METRLKAKFDFPKGLAVTSEGGLLIADSLNHVDSLFAEWPSIDDCRYSYKQVKLMAWSKQLSFTIQRMCL